MNDAVRNAAADFDIPGQAVIGTALDGSIVYWNRGASELYGWPEADVIGRNVLEITPSTMSVEQGKRILELLQNGHTWSGEFVVQTRAGESFAVHVRDVPVRSSNGELVGIVGISRRV